MIFAVIPRFAFYKNFKEMLNKSIVGNYTYTHDDDDDGGDQSG